jgi:protein-tyrosine phosphatase
MIDIHCHILPGIDDGPATLDEAARMCRMAAADGISTIVATPHFKPGRFAASTAQVMEAIVALEEKIRRDEIILRLLPGADITVVPELAAYLKKEPYLSINRAAYFLAELPHDSVLPRWEQFLLSQLDHGKVPILTHPERNHWFLNHPDALYSFVARGGFVQITAMSLTGQFGEEAGEFCRLLLRHNLAHVIASDAHNITRRPPILSEAVKAAAEVVGIARARALVTSIPQAIIEGRQITAPEPEPIAAGRKRKTWMQKLVS